MRGVPRCQITVMGGWGAFFGHGAARDERVFMPAQPVSCFDPARENLRMGDADIESIFAALTDEAFVRAADAAERASGHFVRDADVLKWLNC